MQNMRTLYFYIDIPSGNLRSTPVFKTVWMELRCLCQVNLF